MLWNEMVNYGRIKWEWPSMSKKKSIYLRKPLYDEGSIWNFLSVPKSGFFLGDFLESDWVTWLRSIEFFCKALSFFARSLSFLLNPWVFFQIPEFFHAYSFKVKANPSKFSFLLKIEAPIWYVVSIIYV